MLSSFYWRVPSRPAPQEPTAQPLFKTGVERVALAAIVRDGKGRLVTDLTAARLRAAGLGPSEAIDWRLVRAQSRKRGRAAGRQRKHGDQVRASARVLALRAGGLQPGVDEAALFLLTRN